MFQGKGFVRGFNYRFAIMSAATLAFAQCGLHAQAFAPPINLSSENSNATAPRIAVDSHGDVDAVWLDDRAGTPAVFFSRSSDRGQTFSNPLNISNHSGSPADSERVAVDPAGNIYVVWSEDSSGAHTIFFTRSTDNGMSFSVPQMLSQNSMGIDPAIAIDSGGGVNLLWVDNSDGQRAVFFSRSTDQGASFSTPAPPDATALGEGSTSSSAPSSNPAASGSVVQPSAADPAASNSAASSTGGNITISGNLVATAGKNDVNLRRMNTIRVADEFPGEDCGEKINAADADLGSTPGQVWVSQMCGLRWSTAVTLSANHLLKLIQCGFFQITHTINLGVGSGIEGPTEAMSTGTSSRPCTLAAASGAELSAVISLNGAFSFVHDIVVDGNRKNGGTSGITASDIFINRASRFEIERVTTENSSGHGLWISSARNLNESCCGKISKLMSIGNVADGLYESNTCDTFIDMSEFENNGANGIEMYNSGATRLEHSDIGGNGSVSGKGIYIWGDSTSSPSNGEIIVGNQFGNNYQEDIYVAGFNGGWTAFRQTIVGNQFIGSTRRPDAAYADVEFVDGFKDQIAGNYFGSGGTGHRTTYGLLFTESTPGFSSPSVITGNGFAADFASDPYSDSGVVNKENFGANDEGRPGGFFRLGPEPYLLNNSSMDSLDNRGEITHLFQLGNNNTLYYFGHPTQQDIEFQPKPGISALSLTASEATFNVPISRINSGFLIGGCTTPRHAFASCTSTINLSRPEPDTDYVASCTGVAPSGWPYVIGITSKATSSITIQIGNGSGPAAVPSSFGEIDCTVTR